MGNLPFRESVCFNDVLLVPQMSSIISRADINITQSLYNHGPLNLPIISSPMDTVTETSMSIAMHQSGGLGIVHRYNSIDEQANLVSDACIDGMCNAGAAIGVSGEYLERARALYDAGARVICIDVAHGHHVLMRYALETLRNTFGTSIHVMAGNVATLEGFNALADWGADSIRVGIGGGSICSTRIQTGHGVPTLQSIIDCSRTDRDASIIADGGIKTSGDAVKALAAGADFVMLGSMLSGTNETPGAYFRKDGRAYKKYRGMASKEAQMDWRGYLSSREGVSTLVELKGSVIQVLEDIESGIRSGFSYSGASSIEELQVKARFIKQTSNGSAESESHILHVK